ncbi:MAG TPA: transposase [Coleofasciculaceae cyanobacterium]
MAYSSDLTDEQWKIFEPLLLQMVPKKKRTRPSNWTKREIVNGILYQAASIVSQRTVPPTK